MQKTPITEKKKILTLISVVVFMAITSTTLFSFLSQENEQQPKNGVSGYITTISEGGEYMLGIESRDNYNRYEVENNVGTFNYTGKIYQTHRVTLCRDQTKSKVSLNNVIDYSLE